MAEVSETVLCHHCGETCKSENIVYDNKNFCCSGCKAVYELLQDNDLCGYYDLNDHAGVSLKSKNFEGRYDYLQNTEIEASLLDFKSESINKVTLFLPDVHCSSCVWLLENFHKLHAGVLYSRLNFLKKELSITYQPQKTNLKNIVSLLSTLGYEPQISLESTEKKNDSPKKGNNRLIRQIAVTGFCTGNIMLLSFPEYFRFDIQNAVDAQYQKFFLYLNVLLALPVYFYGASDYLKGAWVSLRELWKRNTHVLSVDIPIALGVTALFIRSSYETFFNGGGAYWDSMAGLVFFLLAGKWVQQKTFDFLSFKRNYKSYFPLAVEVRKTDGSFDYKNVEGLLVGDVIRIRNNELIPADAKLVSGRAFIDYSFVTGESDPLSIRDNEPIFAGGRQKGELLELEVAKEVSKSYLTQLWNQNNIKKDKELTNTRIAENFSKYFTYITLGIAFLTAIYWFFTDKHVIWPAFTAVLMVACPCALTLSMPFAMGTAMGILGKNKFYVKNQLVIQKLNEITDIVFDKTGTLTQNRMTSLNYCGEPLSDTEKSFIRSLTINSTHPISKELNRMYSGYDIVPVSDLKETEGAGVSGRSETSLLQLGHADFLNVANNDRNEKARVYLQINGKYKGFYTSKPVFRNGFEQVIKKLKSAFQLYVLSGDRPTDRSSLAGVLEDKNLHFDQKPQDKLNFIDSLQSSGAKVMMVGDGLNDAGALWKSDIGIAMSEEAQSFTPASDAILDASQFDKLPLYIRFGKKAVFMVKMSFLLSLVYNFIAISWAVTGTLSPVIAAIFMPLSSMSVVLFAVAGTYIVAYRSKLLTQ
jgi:Cu+-exporting ATPase